MKIVFFGTPSYVLPILETLNKRLKHNHESPISAVVTQKPKPSGRKKLLEYSAIDQWAHDRGKPIFFQSLELIDKSVKADIGILAAFGEIIPQKVIDYFPYGILNIHPSLLPEFRGASPVQAAIVSGKTKTGVSIIKMDKQLDHGPIVSQFTEEVLENDTTQSLRERLFDRSAEVLETLIPAYTEGKINPKKQDHDNATFCKMIKKSDAFIDPVFLNSVLNGKAVKEKWEIPFVRDFTANYTATSIHNFIRAMNPWPQAWTLLRLDSSGQAKRLKLISSHLELENQESNIGNLVLDEVQLEGKNSISWKQFIAGYPQIKFQ